MSTMTTPAPSAPATSQATPAELAARRVRDAERALERAREDYGKARERRRAAELAAGAAIGAAETLLEAARLLALPEVVALEALPLQAREALHSEAGRRANRVDCPGAKRQLERARALARLAGVAGIPFAGEPAACGL